MINIKTIASAFAIGALTLLGACDDRENTNEVNADVQSVEYERGPHRGRMLRDGNFAVEVTIYEAGVPPQFRLYTYWDDAPIAPDQVEVSVELERLGGGINPFNFQTENDYLVGDGIVTEPHSFFVRVKARHKGKSFNWAYPSYEGRTTISTETAREAGIEVDSVGPAIIEEKLDVVGRVDLAPDAKASIKARYAGQVVAVMKSVGDKVEKGDVLARVESNESLRVYDIRSPIDGTILERLTNVGDVSGKDDMFVIGDLSRLHVDFHVFPKDMSRVAIGQKATVTSVNDQVVSETEIRSFLPTKELETQTVLARALLPNPNGKWMPGMTVRGDIVVNNAKVPLAVRTEAIQRFRDFQVVFARVGETYEVRMLDLGRQTTEWTEVLGGIRPGQDYVSKNSFLIRADIEKSGASHDH